MHKVIVAFCLLLIFGSGASTFFNGETGDSFSNCQTPDNKEGTCVNLFECPALNHLLANKTVTNAQRSLLQASYCGYHNSKYLVCCDKRNLNLLPEFPNYASHSNRKLFGGFKTELDEFPWLAKIEYAKPGNIKGFYCGGSLINGRYVLTAARCVKGLPEGLSPISVRLGEWDTTTSPDCENMECTNDHEDVSIEKIISHQQYTPSSRNHHHDIALIRLSRKVNFSDFIQPICLPLQVSQRDAQFEGLLLDVAGWGVSATQSQSHIKQNTYLTVRNVKECQIQYASLEVEIDTSGQLCAYDKENLRKCSSDTGGPLFYTQFAERPYYILAGIASLGSNLCGESGWPGVYTRVGQYVDWIRQHLVP